MRTSPYTPMLTMWSAALAFLAASLLAGCSTRPAALPAPPADPVIAKVAVPVPCEIAQVPKGEDPAKGARKGDNVFDLAKRALASRRALQAENEELRAANKTPCPVPGK